LEVELVSPRVVRAVSFLFLVITAAVPSFAQQTGAARDGGFQGGS